MRVVIFWAMYHHSLGHEKKALLNVLFQCSFSVKQIVVYVNTEYRSMFPRANCLEFCKDSH